MTALVDRLAMTDDSWRHLAGGTGEAAWLARRTTKLALGTSLANELLLLSRELRTRGATYRCSADILEELPQAGFWYACLAGFAGKTLGYIRQGPMSFGMDASVKGMVDGFGGGRVYSRPQREAFSAWINDEIDRSHPDASRDPDRAAAIVAMIAGGRVLGQSQNLGGNEAVTIFKTELVGALNERDVAVEIGDGDCGAWIAYSPEHSLASCSYLRIPGRAIFQMVAGGNRPDVVIYPDDRPAAGPLRPVLPQQADDGILAVGEIKGRIDLANAWESWMPQVVTHMRQWSTAYPNAARLFFGTLLTEQMVGRTTGDERETLRSIHAEIAHESNRLTAAYNLTLVADRDDGAVGHFGNFVSAIAGLG